MRFFTLTILSALFLANFSFAAEKRGPSFARSGIEKAECYYNEAGEFVLKGGFDHQASNCFAQTYKPGTKTIRITSKGGSVPTGLGLAHWLKDEDFHLIVEDKCNSACAVYILPLARELTVLKGSSIILHGAPSHDLLKRIRTANGKRRMIDRNIESGYSKKEAKKEYKNTIKYLKRNIATQEPFKARFNIGDGWFMEPESWTEDNSRVPVADDAETWLQKMM